MGKKRSTQRAVSMQKMVSTQRAVSTRDVQYRRTMFLVAMGIRVTLAIPGQPWIVSHAFCIVFLSEYP